jgi:pimeloyl-ACP methyl ester carboxylesterase
VAASPSSPSRRQPGARAARRAGGVEVSSRYLEGRRRRQDAPTLTGPMKHLQAVALALILGLAGCGTEPGSPTSSQIPSPFVDVGGYSLWLECTGQGSPTVILEAGAGNDSGTWHRVMPTISGFTRVCRYDRAGLGNSDARPEAGTVTATRVVDELHALLGAAHIEPPYVLIGHSYGGGLIRLYAAAYRVDVEAIVLEDSISEDQVCNRISRKLAELEGHCGELVDGANRVDLRAMASELRASRTLGGLPLVVLSHGVPFEFPELDRRENRAVEHLWASYQAGLARLSTDSLHVIATRSDHYIHEAQPALFVEAVRLAVQAARGHQFPPCQQVFTMVEGECL